MHRALEREGLAEDRHPARYVLHRENATERIVGRVLDKGVCTENLIRVDDVMESPKLAE